MSSHLQFYWYHFPLCIGWGYCATYPDTAAGGPTSRQCAPGIACSYIFWVIFYWKALLFSTHWIPWILQSLNHTHTHTYFATFKGPSSMCKVCCGSWLKGSLMKSSEDYVPWRDQRGSYFLDYYYSELCRCVCLHVGMRMRKQVCC